MEHTVVQPFDNRYCPSCDTTSWGVTAWFTHCQRCGDRFVTPVEDSDGNEYTVRYTHDELEAATAKAGGLGVAAGVLLTIAIVLAIMLGAG
jgi:hypothetical protein